MVIINGNYQDYNSIGNNNNNNNNIEKKRKEKMITC